MEFYNLRKRLMEKEKTMEFCDLRKKLLQLILDRTYPNKAAGKLAIKQFNEAWPQDGHYKSWLLWPLLDSITREEYEHDKTNYNE